jgi:hypothetical protein
VPAALLRHQEPALPASPRQTDPCRSAPVAARAASPAVAALLALLSAGCGAAGAPQPIEGLAAGGWSWVDFPDSSCQDGSATGLAVSRGTSEDLVVFLNGGGACWDYLTCAVLDVASRGPFGHTEFEALAARLPGSILDRALAGNPYREATLVFVPYCTGDVHAGSEVVSYTGAGGTVRYRHVGHANVEAFLRRLAATFPAPRRLVVAGASAGGFGALVNYDAFRRTWPAAEAMLLDDSGPPLLPGAVSRTLLDAWRQSWGLDRLLDPLCGAACRDGFAPLLPVLAARYPRDRLALLSSRRDQVISSYYLLGGAAFEADLDRMLAEALAPLPSARSFVVPGTSHTMLGAPAGFTQGVSLLEWLGQQWSGDPAWASQHP